MKKRLMLAVGCLLGLFFANCTRTYNPILDVVPPVDKEILIRTGQINYKTDYPIDIKVTNLLDNEAAYQTCGKQDLLPSLVLMFDSGRWIEAEVSDLCPQDDPVCYCGTLKSSAEADRKIILPSPGLYKLRYSFEVKSALVHFFSNEFEVIN